MLHTLHTLQMLGDQYKMGVGRADYWEALGKVLENIGKHK